MVNKLLSFAVRCARKNQWLPSSTLTSVLLTVALIAAGANGARADTITFDEGTLNTEVGFFYSTLGVTFFNASFGPNFGLVGSSGPLGIFATVGDTQPTAADPIVAVFDSVQGSVGIAALDVGARGVKFDAYDAPSGGTLVGSQTVVGAGDGVGEFFVLSLAAPTIRRVEFYQPFNTNRTDGARFDTFSFEPVMSSVPEPATIYLFGCTLGLYATVRKYGALRAFSGRRAQS